MQGTLAKLVAAIPGARLVGADVAFGGVSTDSRKVDAGALFVALRGEIVRRPRFPRPGRARDGAAVVVVERCRTAGRCRRSWCPTRWLRWAASRMPGAASFEHARHRRHRQQRQDDGQGNDRVDPGRGASARDARLATHGNLNNEIGVPLTLFRLDGLAPRRRGRTGHEPSGRDRPPGGHRRADGRAGQQCAARAPGIHAHRGSGGARKRRRAAGAAGRTAWPCSRATTPYTGLWRGLAALRTSSRSASTTPATCAPTTRATASAATCEVTRARARSSPSSWPRPANTMCATRWPRSPARWRAGIEPRRDRARPRSLRAGQRPPAAQAGRRRRHRHRRHLQRQSRFDARRHRRAGQRIRRRASWWWATWAKSARRDASFTKRSAPTRRRAASTTVLATGELARHLAASRRTALRAVRRVIGSTGYKNWAAISDATVLVKGSRFMKMERVVQHLIGSHTTGKDAH